MTYELALSYLASLNESRIKPGLERIQEALLALGSPHLKFPHLLVGGTNGKGSVVSFMGAAMSGAGYRTGLYTSPHLRRFEERIVIDNRPLTADELARLVQTVKGAGSEMTYFEFATAMALLHFADKGVDLAILEVGIGGSWDATNASDPMLSVITTVEADHREWLGDALQEVAREKSGIMRRGKPVVVGRLGDTARQVVLEQAGIAGAWVVLSGRDYSLEKDPMSDGLQFTGAKWKIRGLDPGLKGRFQLDNAACALAALEILATTGFNISEKVASNGINSAHWPGRFQKVEGAPPIIVDAAHNPAAVRALVSSLDNVQQITWLFAALAGKDLQGMVSEMLKVSDRFVLVPLDHPRARTVSELEKDMPENAQLIRASSVKKGIEEARIRAGEGGLVVVAGSVVLAGEVLTILGNEGLEI